MEYAVCQDCNWEGPTELVIAGICPVCGWDDVCIFMSATDEEDF